MILENVKIEVFLGCYASYNDGYLFDKCYTVTTADELDDACQAFQKHVLNCIKKEKPEWVEDGYIDDETYAEELYAADYEVYINGEFYNADFGESIWDMRNFLEKYEDVSFDYDFKLICEFSKCRGIDLEEANDALNNAFVLHVDSQSNEDLAHAYIESTCMFQECENETLIRYFDYDSFGRDLYSEFTCYETSDGYVAIGDY